MSRNENQQIESTFNDSNELLEERKMPARSLVNILLMSVSFLLIFTAFNSSSLIQQTVVESINSHLHVGWDGFTSLCIIYGVFSFSNFLVPSILSVVSSARCLFFSALTYLAYTITFLYPVRFSLEIVSIVVGFGAAVIWTAQGNYLTENSDSKSIDWNTGIFWAIFQGSLVFGNLFVYFQLSEKGTIPGVIEENVRFKIYFVLSTVCAIGCVLLLFLGKTTSRTITADPTIANQTDPLKAFKKCLKLFKTKKMLLLSVACFFSGLELSFYSGIYPSAIGRSTGLDPNPKKYIGIYGCLVGSGSILGGLLFGLSGKRFVQNNRSRVFLLGFMVHIIAYFFIFLNHPSNSTIPQNKSNTTISSVSLLDNNGISSKDIMNETYTSEVWLVMLSGFLLGFGDACFNTQIISLIGCVYTDDSNYTSSAFALYKFTQSIAASISFFYSTAGLPLFAHLIILVVFSVFGSISFVLVELFVRREIE